MTGTITKHKLKSGRLSWGYCFRAGRGPDGKWIQPTKRGYSRKSEAEEALRNAIAEYEAKKSPADDTRTFAEFFDFWMIEHATQQCQRKTIEAYAAQGVYAKRMFGDMQLRDLKPMLLEQGFNRLRESGGMAGRPLAPKTVQHIASLVSSCLGTAARWEILKTNPMERVKLPTLTKREVNVLDHQALLRVFDRAKGTRLYPFLVLASATGARRGEVLALRWSDIDFDSGVMTVSKSLEQTKKSGVRVKETKSKKPRKFVVPRFALAVLEEHRAEQENDKCMFEDSYRDEQYVFCPPEGGFYHPDRVTGRVSELLRKMGLPRGISLHTLRHSHASGLLSKGVPVPTVSKLLGHASPNVTLQIYSHPLAADEIAASRVWNDALLEAIGGDAENMTPQAVLGIARKSRTEFD